MSLIKAHSEDYKGYRITIYYDPDPDNPRSWDNLGTIVYSSSQYNLGDTRMSPDEFFDLVHVAPLDYEDDPEWQAAHKALCDAEFGSGRRQALREERDRCAERIDARNAERPLRDDVILLPVYAYIHSGVSLSCGDGYPYNDRWDGGQSGWIYTTADKVRETWTTKDQPKTADGRHYICRFSDGDVLLPVKGPLPEDITQRVKEALKGEVETFNAFLEGNVFGYQTEGPDGEGDSCWGFYPDHDNSPLYKYCLDEARSAVDHTIQSKWAQGYKEPGLPLAVDYDCENVTPC